MEHIRPAGPSDHPRCVELLTTLRASVTSVRGGADLLTLGVTAPDSRSAHTAELTDPRTLVERWSSDPTGATLLVGEYEGALVGLAAGTIDRGVRTVGRIECCYVEEEARAVGVGHGLIEGLLTWFAEQGCSDVDALALPGDRSTKQLLEGSGFRARLLVLHRPLG